MAVRIGWRQALAWRMRRQHLLGPVGAAETVEAIVGRLCGVQAQVASSAELAVRIRMAESEPGVVGQALDDGRVIRTWAMRGSLHLLDPASGGALLSLIAAGRSWERPSWVRYFGATPDVMSSLREAVVEALDGPALSREELIEAVVRRPGLDHVGEALRSGWGTLLKPLAWQGVLCHGPSRGNRVTFTRPDVASDRWAGLPTPDEAAPSAIAAYVGAYGPARIDAFGHWLAGGWFGTRRLRGWAAALGARLVDVEVDGEPALALAEHVDELAATDPTTEVRLLPGFDQYVLGPGTADGHVVPSHRRSAVSRTAGWISPVVVVGGVVSGTWALEGDVVRVAWFPEAGDIPRRALDAEVQRLAGLRGRGLEVEIGLV
jgi:hypothetical protein